MKPEEAKEIEQAANKLFAELSAQLEEWKAYLKSLIPDNDYVQGEVDGIKISGIHVTAAAPNSEQPPTIRVTYEMSDPLVAFAKLGQAPEGFRKALLEHGIDLETVAEETFE